MASMPDIQERIERFPTACRSAGLKVTPQRIAVFSMLVNTKAHPSPEEVFIEIRKTSPSISLATVYKILEMFHLKGFIKRVSTNDQVTRYDGNLEPHHHVICNQCGHIKDIMGVVDTLPEPTNGELGGFQITSKEIQYHGTCADCASNN